MIAMCGDCTSLAARNSLICLLKIHHIFFRCGRQLHEICVRCAVLCYAAPAVLRQGLCNPNDTNRYRLSAVHSHGDLWSGMTITSCCLANSLATRRCWHPRLFLQHFSYYHIFRSNCSKLRNRPDSRFISTQTRPAFQKPAAVLDMSRNINNGSAYLQASQCCRS